MRLHSYDKKVQTEYVSTKKLPVKLLYEKATRKMLVKLNKGRNAVMGGQTSDGPSPKMKYDRYFKNLHLKKIRTGKI